MNAIFLKLFNMGITASWLILVVIILRFLLRKAPKWINCLLWGIVALRLIMPFSLESMFSLIPSAEPIPQDIVTSPSATINSGIPSLNNIMNPIITDSLSSEVGASVNSLQIILSTASIIWIVGMGAMLIYSLVSYIRLHKRLQISLLYQNNIYYCDSIDFPFIFGIIKPKIYLPSGIPEEQINYIIQHENAHLERHDNWWKPFGFVLLTIYWFHPIILLAYILFCRDIEMACDEKVIKNMDNNAKKGYSQALLSCSLQRRKPIGAFSKEHTLKNWHCYNF